MSEWSAQHVCAARHEAKVTVGQAMALIQAATACVDIVAGNSPDHLHLPLDAETVNQLNQSARALLVATNRITRHPQGPYSPEEATVPLKPKHKRIVTVEQGNQLLLQAASQGNLAQLKLLIGEVDLNITDQFGNTPLIQAVYHEQLEAVRLLLGGGALGRARTISGGKNALEIAIEFGHTEIAQLLDEHWSIAEHPYFSREFRQRAMGTVLALVEVLPPFVFEVVFSTWNRAEIPATPELYS
eukprot:TRINITY_DN49655_c0_g1_i2.p1 TRINITY_DN49655_c0_g1~~TRINITY_DN49655_c0_g1_i2.p1  ORF type:complete len:243 (-),score=35.78 TRINITY_DN49655_c0_g1_i2:334-1062(-)